LKLDLLFASTRWSAFGRRHRLSGLCGLELFLQFGDFLLKTVPLGLDRCL
jgi:hypothetical protein